MHIPIEQITRQLDSYLCFTGRVMSLTEELKPIQCMTINILVCS